MTDSLRVLLLEDSDTDAELVAREVRKTVPRCDVRRVDTRAEFERELIDFRPGLILSDHRLGRFNGMQALELARERAGDTPFLFVTGSLDEETAAESVKAGAWDYVLKDRLARLGPAIRSALELRRTREALRRSQEQLQQAQKMDALGRLASGVAHDYNNLMTAVMGYCALINETFEAGDPRLEDVAEIRHAAERAADLTRQLMAFSRTQVIQPQPIDLNAVVETTERLLRRLIGEHIAIGLDLAADLPVTMWHAGQVEQVIMNLAVNARDAMPHGGTLRLETRAFASRPEAVPADGDHPQGPYLCLRVADTGVGIDPVVLEHIFEPFFTTKGRGHGTGFGLATVYGIVRQAHGHIDVVSVLGRGTTFTIYVPVVSVPAIVRGRARATARTSRALAGSETILVVEDDQAVRELTRRVLAIYGYRVLDAGTPDEALEAAAGAGRIDLLLTDMVLPEMSGVALADTLVRQHPGLRVVFMSGYTEAEPTCPAPELSAGALLEKPFIPQVLVGRVREALDADTP